MNRTLKKSLLSAGALLATQLFAGVAMAAPPTSVWGTWTLTANQTFETLTITNQGNSTASCKVILGAIGGAAAPIYGFYCPDTGRIHFIHKNLFSKVPIRVFDGIASDVVVGSPNRISGTYPRTTRPRSPLVTTGFPRPSSEIEERAALTNPDVEPNDFGIWPLIF